MIELDANSCSPGSRFRFCRRFGDEPLDLPSSNEEVTTTALLSARRMSLESTEKNNIQAVALRQNIDIRSLPFLQFGKIINSPKEGLLMARELRCADLMPGCNFVAQGKDDSEVMKKAAEHAKSVHKMAAISMDVEKKARAAIRDAGT